MKTPRTPSGSFSRRSVRDRLITLKLGSDTHPGPLDAGRQKCSTPRPGDIDRPVIPGQSVCLSAAAQRSTFKATVR